MTFPFYPKLEMQCPNVSHCPHLGGALIGAVVMVANHSEQNDGHLVRQIGVLEKENAQLLSQSSNFKSNSPRPNWN